VVVEWSWHWELGEVKAALSHVGIKSIVGEGIVEKFREVLNSSQKPENSLRA
jgi:hypothetical protein